MVAYRERQLPSPTPSHAISACSTATTVKSQGPVLVLPGQPVEELDGLPPELAKERFDRYVMRQHETLKIAHKNIDIAHENIGIMYNYYHSRFAH